MDRLTFYQQTIHQLLAEYQALYSDPQPSTVAVEVVADDTRGQYLLLRVGWQGETRIRRTILYIRLKENQLWIEEDRTKDGFIEDLRAAGVPEDDIVLAFNPPILRPSSFQQAA